MEILCVDEVPELISLAWRAADAGRNREANLSFQRAIRIDQTIHARIEYAEFLANFVSMESAIDQLEICLNRSQEDQCADGCVFICNRLAVLYRDLGNAPLAESYQQLAISIEMRMGDSPIRRTTTLGFAHDLIQKGEFEPARFLLVSLSQGDDSIANQARISLASLSLRENDPTTVHILLDQVSQWLIGHAEIPQLVQTLKLRSQAYVAEENFEAAEESLAEAIRLVENNARCLHFLPQLKSDRIDLARKKSILCQLPHWN